MLKFLVKANSFNQADLATSLSVQVFDKDETFAEKLRLPSSVIIHNRNEATDDVILRVKADFNLQNDAFLGFLKEAYKVFPK